MRDAFSGPYLVDGAPVTARPMFRMLRYKSDATVAVVMRAALRANVQAGSSIVGQPLPRQLVKITQALIDAGCLPPGPGDAASRIRQMQWDHGIGVDGAGYAKQALAASALRIPTMYQPGWESFRDLDTKRKSSFARQLLANARPGDLITLDPIDPAVYGHNVVVYSHTTTGPRHLFEVDSSWAAGAEGDPSGGYRRDTWTYDEEAREWTSFDPRTTPPRLQVSMLGPAGDAYHATYRPR